MHYVCTRATSTSLSTAQDHKCLKIAQLTAVSASSKFIIGKHAQVCKLWRCIISGVDSPDERGGKV